jgi:hypothetical protein
MIGFKSGAQICELKAVSMSILRPSKTASILPGAGCAVLALLFAISTLAAAQIRLLPAPREAHFGQETVVPATIAVSVPGHDAEDAFAARDLEDAVKKAGTGQSKAVFRVVLLRTGSAEAKALLARRGLSFDAAMKDEGYVLAIEPHQAYVVAASASGVFYGPACRRQACAAYGNGARLAGHALSRHRRRSLPRPVSDPRVSEAPDSRFRFVQGQYLLALF